jgi:predicted component of type VI protein secretion system
MGEERGSKIAGAPWVDRQPKVVQMIGIRIVSRAGAPLQDGPSATFGEAGGEIGRGADCALVLPDPDRHISRKHLLVTCRNGRHYVRQVGAGVEVSLDGEAMALEVDYPIGEGTEIEVGPYRLQAGSTRAWHELDLVVGEPTDTGVRPLVPPPEQAVPPAEPVTTPPSEASSVPHDAEDLLEALYRGLGQPLPAPAQRSPQQLALIGGLLRSSIEGVLGLLATRMLAKRELGAAATQLRARENNPLKFSPDVDSAMGHLLGPERRGFIAPQAAVGEAFADLRAHEMAMLAGMRAALDEVLARFDPTALEERLAPKSSWLPSGRKAELWQGYTEHYADLVREIGGDFDSLFGTAFVRAYQEQLDELARGAGDSGRAH